MWGPGKHGGLCDCTNWRPMEPALVEAPLVSVWTNKFRKLWYIPSSLGVSPFQWHDSRETQIFCQTFFWHSHAGLLCALGREGWSLCPCWGDTPWGEQQQYLAWGRRQSSPRIASRGLGDVEQQQRWQVYLERKFANAKIMLGFFCDSCYKQTRKKTDPVGISYSHSREDDLESWFSSVQSLSCVLLFVTPWTAACQASLSITNSQSPPKPMSIESVMPSNHLILCCPLLFLLSVFPASGSFPMS